MSYLFEKLCDSERLKSEISASAIVTALDYILTTSSPETTDVYFKASLSSEDEAILSALVSDHVNTPLPDNAVSSVSVVQLDTDTGGLSTSPKFAPTGWHQQYFETEFQTSDSSETSIHEKDWLNQNIGFSTLKFYDADENELTDQNDIDTSCVRTDLLWMPTVDYAIKSGYVSQKVVPSENLYVWALGVDLPAMFGGPQAVFAEGGINMTYVDARVKAGLDGVAATVLRYTHPALGAGAGTNRLRYVVRHPAGFKHRIQVVMEIFLQ